MLIAVQSRMQTIIAMASIYGDDKLKEQAFAESIPEFKRFNIVEREVRSVI